MAGAVVLAATTIFTKSDSAKLDRILALLKTMNARLDFHVQQLLPLPTTTSASPPMLALKLVEGEASLVADPTLQPTLPLRHWPPVEIAASERVTIAVPRSADPSAGSAALCGPKARLAPSPSAPIGATAARA
jgi:hypothetical protein